MKILFLRLPDTAEHIEDTCSVRITAIAQILLGIEVESLPDHLRSEFPGHDFFFWHHKWVVDWKTPPEAPESPETQVAFNDLPSEAQDWIGDLENGYGENYCIGPGEVLNFPVIDADSPKLRANPFLFQCVAYESNEEELDLASTAALLDFLSEEYTTNPIWV
jgi:hypothetical protein